MNDLEKIFKTGLDDFEEVSPSKSLWWKLYLSLLFQNIGKKVVVFVALVLLSIGFFFAKNYVQYFQNTSQKKPLVSIASNRNNSLEYSKTDVLEEKKRSQTTSNVSNKTKLNQANFENNSNELKSNVDLKNYIQQNFNPKKVEEVSSLIVPSNPPGIKSASKETDTSSFLTSNNLVENHDFSDEKLIFLPCLAFVTHENIAVDLQKVIVPFRPRAFAQPKILHKIEAYAGPSISKEFLFSSNSNFEPYKNYRLTNETEKITPLLGFNYRVEYNNWFAMLGLNAQQIKRNATYPLPVSVLDSMFSYYSIVRMNYVYNIINYIPNPNKPSDSIPLYALISNPDTTNYTETIYDTNLILQNFSFTQKYSFIEIPFIVGRSYKYKKFEFETSIGVSWARLSKYETKLVNLNFQNLMGEDETQALLVKNTFNGIIGLGAAYSFSENKAVFIRPEFKFNLKNMFNSTFPVAEKNLIMNVAMGIRFDL